MREDITTTFTPVSDRLCMARSKITILNRDIVLINSNAPTLPNSEKQPKIRENFYNTLETLIKLVGSKNI